MNCPICNRPLPPPEQSEAGERYFCDCAGFRRAVVEVIPDKTALEAEPVNVKKKGLKDDRSD